MMDVVQLMHIHKKRLASGKIYIYSIERWIKIKLMGSRINYLIRPNFRRPGNHSDSDSKVERDELRSLSFVKQRLSDFSKRESSMSLCSSTSIESDWSDEELEEVI